VQQVTWRVNGAERPFDGGAQDWRAAMLAVLDTTWELSSLRGEVSTLRGNISTLRGDESTLAKCSPCTARPCFTASGKSNSTETVRLLSDYRGNGRASFRWVVVCHLARTL